MLFFLHFSCSKFSSRTVEAYILVFTQELGMEFKFRSRRGLVGSVLAY